jgi:acetolactate synthase-1/2/3 large subunit
MRFDDRVTGNLETYAKQAKVILIDPLKLTKTKKSSCFGDDVKESLTALFL